jgi:hypothetical protein
MCEQAQGYYYAYLCEGAQESAPREILTHIGECPLCKAEVNRLKAELAGTDGDADRSIGQRTSLVIANLKLHFAHTGALVNCGTVRPFLPSLADPAFEVGVPTPITVHLDKCQQCSDDLETICQLKLTHKQLCRLGQLFAEEFGVGEELCTKAQTAISAVGDCAFEGTSVDILRHFCVCPDCRELLYKYRRSKAEKLSWSAEQSVIPCDAVSAIDTFDYVVLYGLDPEKDEYTTFRPALTSHLTNCRKCLGKMLELHNTVYDILQRAESGIVTCFKADDATQHSIVSNPDEIYKDWPIEVEVFDTSREIDTIDAGDVSSTWLVAAEAKLKAKQRRLRLSIRPLIKPVAAAAAILIVALLVFRGPVAKAVDLNQIYDALKRIKNVYVATYVSEKPEPAQKIWISTVLNIKMFKTGTQYVLWDLRDKTVKSKDLDTDSVKTAQLSKDALASVERTMDVPWGLLPFNKMSVVRVFSDDAIWQGVADENIDTTIPNTEVYDLMWTEKVLGGSMIHKKWRGYLDTKTTLPKRIERWQRLPREDEYELLVVTEVVYPTTDEVQTAIRDAGLYVSSSLPR